MEYQIIVSMTVFVSNRVVLCMFSVGSIRSGNKAVVVNAESPSYTSPTYELTGDVACPQWALSICCDPSVGLSVCPMSPAQKLHFGVCSLQKTNSKLKPHATVELYAIAVIEYGLSLPFYRTIIENLYSPE